MERRKRKRKITELKSLAVKLRSRGKFLCSSDTDDDENKNNNNINYNCLAIKQKDNSRSSDNSDWALLTDQLLLSIVSNLQTLEDLFAFRGVCSRWRSLCYPSPPSFAVSAQHPLLLLPVSATAQSLYDPIVRRFYRSRLPWDTVSRYAVSYSHSHIITTTHGSRPRPILYCLFTGTMTRFPKALLQFDVAFLTADLDDLSCRLVLIHRCRCSLQICGIGDRRWTVYFWAEPSKGIWAIDFTLFKGKLYILTNNLQLGVIDFDAVRSMELIGDRLRGLWFCSWHLVEVGGELVLLSLACQLHGKSSMWRWDFDAGEWTEIRDLCGRSLFIGSDGVSLSSCAAEPSIRAKCSYFAAESGLIVITSLENGRTETIPIDPVVLEFWALRLPPVWVVPI